MAKQQAAKQAEDAVIYVSPDGNDRWSGRYPEPNARGTDGPLASPRAAQQAVRRLKGRGALDRGVRVVLRGGTYFLRAPLVFGPADSGEPEADKHSTGISPRHLVTYAAFPGERPVLSGGRRITGWKQVTLNGRTVWATHVPSVAAGKWHFRQLWVNGRRAKRPRLPKEGLYRIERLPGRPPKGPWTKTVFRGQDRFVFRKGDIQAWRNLRDVEFVALHYWIETRRRIVAVDTRRRVARLEFPSRMRLTDDFQPGGAPYYVENVFEALDEPGQWYLDRPTGTLYYIPLPGERPETAEVIAPVLGEVLRLAGRTEPFVGGKAARGKNAGRPVPAGQPVQCVRFEGLTFSHCEWQPSRQAERLATPQAACHVPGAVQAENVDQVAFHGCHVEHVGGYGMELAAGCRNVQVLACDVTDLGAGGIKVWHGCRRNTIADCEIADGGHLYHSGVGVLIGRSSGNKLLHCHIHDFDYSGISVGWTWGYAEGDAYGNLIEYNHVHHVGRGKLSDLGGVYTLGVSPGTRIRCNLFHDIVSRGYGGWAIYTDEGSTDILIENNLCVRTNCCSFHQHYGRDNVVRNNIFAFGGQGGLHRMRVEAHRSFSFRRNIVLLDNDGQVLAGNWQQLQADVDRNLYWHLGGRRLRFGEQTFRQWQKRGADHEGLVADPRFADPRRGDFRLRPGSPAARIGFVPFDLSGVGPRPEMRRALP